MVGKRDKITGLPASSLSLSFIEQLKDEIYGTEPPDGWISASMLGKALGLNHQALDRLANKKGWECALYASTTEDGRKIKGKHYQIK